MEDKQGTIHLREDYNIKAIRVYWTKSQEEKENRDFFEDRNRWIWNGGLYKQDSCAILFRTFPISENEVVSLRGKNKSIRKDFLDNATEKIFSGGRLEEYEDGLYWRAYKIATNILVGKNGSSLGFNCYLPELDFTSCLDHIKRRRISLEYVTIDKLVESPYCAQGDG
jgi:hypothetical protein